MRLGFDYQTIMAMPERAAWEYLEAAGELNRPPGKRYRVKPKGK